MKEIGSFDAVETRVLHGGNAMFALT